VSKPICDGQEIVLGKVSSERSISVYILLEKLVENGHTVSNFARKKRVALLRQLGQYLGQLKVSLTRKKNAAKAAQTQN